MQTDTIPLILHYQVYGEGNKPLTPTTQGQVDIQLTPNKTIKCEKIILRIPQGPGPDRIFETGTATLNPPDPRYWSVGESQDVPDDQTNIDYRQWVLVNRDPDLLPQNGANCSVSGTVNNNAGTAQVVIKEKTEAPEDNGYQLRTGNFPIDKNGEPAFFMQNLIAIDPLNGGYPCGAIQQGYAAEIRWDSNGTSFELYQSGIATPVHSGKDTSYMLNKGITDTTTFSCVASDGNGNKLIESFTLTVINPVLTPYKVTTNTNEDVTGEITTNKATCDTLDLHCNPGTYPIETLQCSSITADNLTIEHSIDLTHQQLPIFGAFEQLASGTHVSAASKKVNTDGYAIIAVDVSSDDNSAAYGALSFDNNNWFSTYGANDSLDPVHGFLWLPVPAGTTWYYKGENLTSVSNPATISVFWVPMGKDTPAAQQDNVAPPVAGNNSHTNDPRQLFEQYAAAQQQRQTNLIASIETLLDTKFDVATKEEMYRQLTAL